MIGRRLKVYGQGYRLLVLAFLGLALAIAGGASRYDEDQQALVRLAAIAAIAASLWPLELQVLRRRPWLIAGAAAAYLLLAVQLLPLPPDLWSRLPGREVYARIAEAAGVAGAWRPLSLTPDLTLNALFALLPATAAGVCVLHLDFRGRMRLAEAVVAIACASALLGVVQLASGGGLHLYRETSANSAVGLFANRNHQAALLACALPLASVLAGSRLREGADPKVVLSLLAGVLALLLLALVSTGSRMGLALGVIGLAGAGWCWRASGLVLVPRTPRLRLAVAVGAAAVLAMVALAAGRGGAFERLAASNPASDIRAAAFGPLVATAHAFMPFGSGFGSFDSVYRRFEPDALLSTIYLNQAHDEPMQLAIEGGAPALALLALFLGWWAFTSLRILRAELPPLRRALSVASVAITLVLMASSLVDYPLRTPLLSSLFVVACVEMLRAVGGAGRRAEPASRRQASPWA